MERCTSQMLQAVECSGMPVASPLSWPVETNLALYVSIDKMYIADHADCNHRMQEWHPGASAGSTVAGSKGAGRRNDQLNCPTGLFVTEEGFIYHRLCCRLGEQPCDEWKEGWTAGLLVAGYNL
eukprot:4202785-Amphidinium_carterae.2